MQGRGPRAACKKRGSILNTDTKWRKAQSQVGCEARGTEQEDAPQPEPRGLGPRKKKS